jgi:hypothetical protein
LWCLAKNQFCEIILRKVSGAGRGLTKETALFEDSSVVPEQTITVDWSAPLNGFPHHDERSITKADLAVGLFRYGSPENSKAVIAKPLSQSSNKAIRLDKFGNKAYSGSIQFRSPKTAGCFVFRLYDRTSPESMVETLSTSVRFINELYDNDVTSMLLRGIEGFVVS